MIRLLEKRGWGNREKELCPKTGKICYKNHSTAQHAIERKQHRKGAWKNCQIKERSYRCPACNQIHITHSEQVNTGKQKMNKARRCPEWKKESQFQLGPHSGSG